MIAAAVLLTLAQASRTLRDTADPRRPAPAASLDRGAPPEMPQGSGPRGTSGEERYDAVGYGAIVGGGDPGAVTVTSDALPPGSFVELTALDSGKTIVALVAAHGVRGGGIADLSIGAARLLGAVDGTVALRIRLVRPIPQDQVALRGGQAGSPRIDSPEVLLVALRKRLPGSRPTLAARPMPVQRPAPSYAPPPSYAPRPAQSRPGASYAPPGGDDAVAAADPVPARGQGSGGPGWYVQVVTLSSLDRAQALTSSLGGGRIVSTGNLHRVQIGPYASPAEADRARDATARRGYGGAQVIRAR